MSQEERQEHTLVASNFPGRFALDREDGENVSCGLGLEVLICGQWIAGLVEHEFVYITQKGQASGYFLECSDGTWIGLVTGMKVRII